MRKPAFFFQDRDYFEAQKTWELKRNDSDKKVSKKPSKRADMVSSDDQRSAAFSKTNKPLFRLGTPLNSKPRGSTTDRGEYEHNLPPSIQGNKTRNINNHQNDNIRFEK